MSGAPGGAAARDGPPVRVAAHRGGAHLGPEHALLTCRRALALGVDLLEVDVHLTADDVPVLLHDPTLDRTTTGRGPVRARRLAELAPVRLRDRRGAPTRQRVPTLDALLALLRRHRAGLLLELKRDATGAPYPGIEARVLEAVTRAGLCACTVVMAFDPGSLARLRALAPSAATALLLPPGLTEPAPAVASALAVGAGALGVAGPALDPRWVAAARAAGLGLVAWTVNDAPELRRVAALGVDVVVTDRPDLALAVLGRAPGRAGPRA